LNVSPNKKRLESHFIYDWIKYIALVLAVIVVFNFLYSSTEKQLTDVEELRVVMYCYRYDEEKLETVSKEALSEIGNTVNTELKNVSFGSYAYYNNVIESADTVKFGVELGDGIGDVFILPSVSEYRMENPAHANDPEEPAWVFCDHYQYSHQMVSGRNTFVPIDELIAAEKASESAERRQRAERLEELLSTYDEDELYCTYRRFYVDAAIQDPNYYPEDNGEAKKWGINLKVLDEDKLGRLFIGDEDVEFVAGVRNNSENVTDAVAFLVWLFENFT